MPVTKVDSATDGVSPARRAQIAKRNRIAKQAYDIYDAKTMHGLPVGVQIAGQRLEEEKVLAGMKVVEEALKVSGREFKR